MRLLFYAILITLLPLCPLTSAELPLTNHTVIIDAGHGTLNYDGKISNGGKEIRNGLKEHALDLKIAGEVGDALEALGAKIYYTRTDEDYWRTAYNSVDDNKSRAILANALKGDVLISLHCDWHPNHKAQGVTTLYEKENSRFLAEKIHRAMIKELKAKDRRVVRDEFTILGQADMPAIILETGFMSHRQESKKLVQTTYQKRIAKAISSGLINYFQSSLSQ